jgi:hypothetical protein
MATANFKDMEYGMPMVIGGMENYEDMKKAYESETGEEYNEDIYYFDLEEIFRDAEKLAEDFTENLKYHDITIISGYYSGFQFYVEEKYSGYFDLNKSSEYCIENDDAHYYFDVCRSVAIRESDREKRKIKRWLESLVNYGYDIIVCVGRFSNGEAVYTTRTPKTELISITNGY